MDIPIEKKRNILLTSHNGSGKTTLAESILFNAGMTDKRGSVDDESSVLDNTPEEKKRRMTLSASLHHYRWDGFHVNIIDTPGYSNFFHEAIGAMDVVEGAVVVVSSAGGIKVGTERAWEYTEKKGLKRMVFLNKMDHERAEFDVRLKEAEEVFGKKMLPLTIPAGERDGFRGVVELLTMKAFIYDDDGSGKFKKTDCPEELKDHALERREALIEAVVEADDTLTERYLEGEELTVDELTRALRSAVLNDMFVPVMCGSALKNVGVNLLMDAVNLYMPSPLDREVFGTDVSGEPIGFETQQDDTQFIAFVFKTLIEPFAGRLSFLRVYSGSVSPDSTVLNTTRDVKEKLSHLYMVEGGRTREVGSASAGDIVATAKLKDTHTGDTLVAGNRKVVFAPPERIPAVLSYAVTPKTKGDEEKLHSAMEKLMEEDPGVEFRRDDETKEFLISGYGQAHLEVIVERLKRKYGCEVELQRPKIPYKETIRSTAKAQGKYKKQSGGRGQYGDTWLELSPLPRGAGFEFVDNIVGGVIPRQYIPAVEKGVREAMQSGVVAGYPVVDVKVRLYDGSHHSVDSSDMAFKIAASMGFKKAMEAADPVLLEPIMKMEIVVPEENMGDIMGDINARRGRIQGVESRRAGYTTVKALVPMAEIIDYASDLKGMTADKGTFTMTFSHYQEVPPHIAEKVKSAVSKER